MMKKNLNENWLVVEDISQNISHLVEQITVDDIALKSLRKVQHLIRKMQAKLTALLYGCRFAEGDSSNGGCIQAYHSSKRRKALAEIETF